MLELEKRIVYPSVRDGGETPVLYVEYENLCYSKSEVSAFEKVPTHILITFQ